MALDEIKERERELRYMVRRPGIEPGSPSLYVPRDIPESWQPGILTILHSIKKYDRIYTSNAYLKSM